MNLIQKSNKMKAKLHNEALNLYSPLNMIRVIKSMRMRGQGMWYTWADEECM